MKTPIKETTEESLVMTVLELAGILNKRGMNVTANTGITTQQWLVLLHLYQDPNIPQFQNKPVKEEGGGWLASEIATALNVSRPYITNLVNILLKKGFIDSTPSTQDQRKKLLTLSNKGVEVINMLQPYRQKANQHLFRGLNEQEREQALSIMNKCLQNLKKPYKTN